MVKGLLGIKNVTNIPFHGEFWGYTVLSEEQLLFRVVALSGMLVLSVLGYRTVTARETMIPNALDRKDLEAIKQMDDDCLYNTLLKQREIIFWSSMNLCWPFINFIATFFHIPLLLVIVWQSLYWKLSWVMIIYLFFAIGPWYSLDLDFLQTPNQGENDKSLTYYSNIAVREQRHKKWKTLMWITMMAWIIIFPSHKVLDVLDMSIRTKTIFYGEWVGILYPNTTPGVTFWNYVSGYIIILSMLVLEKKFLEWLAGEDERQNTLLYQETIGERDNKKNYEILSKEIEARKEKDDKRNGKGKNNAGKVGFSGVDEEGKIDPKAQVKEVIDILLPRLSENTGRKKSKEETKKPHSPYLKSAMKKTNSGIKKNPNLLRTEGPAGPKPFDETMKSNDTVNNDDEEFNLIFTRDDPARNETRKKLLFQYKIKFMRGAKTFAEECITFALLI